MTIRRERSDLQTLIADDDAGAVHRGGGQGREEALPRGAALRARARPVLHPRRLARQLPGP
eukprot:123584-Rhodomonas_salina.1